MNANDYQQAALRTANPKCRSLINCALGLTGEAGEFADMIKKHEFHGHELDRDAAIKEISDVLWYAAVAADVLGVTLSEVMQVNIDKLKKRYPNGFSTEDSVARVDVNAPVTLNISEEEVKRMASLLSEAVIDAREGSKHEVLQRVYQ